MTTMTTLIIPGYRGSEEAHWQSWIQYQLANSKRVEQDWQSPVLAHWVKNIRNEIDESVGKVWLLAHSFGCLAAIVASMDRREKIAGAMLVAPADPERFTLGGMKTEGLDKANESIRSLIPIEPLPFPSLVIASDNDPWMQANKAKLWCQCWESQFLILQSAGHINTNSGFGPWLGGLKLFQNFQAANPGNLHRDSKFKNHIHPAGKGSQLAKLQLATRHYMGIS